jgi:hypothetical protein
MTMKVTIKNEDPARTATVHEETFAVGKAYPSHIVSPAVVLGPGMARSFHIHAAKRLIVNEDAEAEILKAPR